MERINFARLGYSQEDLSRLILRDLEVEKDRLTAKIIETQQILGKAPKSFRAKLTGRKATAVIANGTGKRTHKMSKAGREAVAAAQKRRWAKVRREKKALAAKPRRSKGKETQKSE